MDKINGLANEIVSTAVLELCGEFTYFSYAIGLLNFSVADGVNKLVTNGKSAFLDQNYTVEITASKGVAEVKSAVLHATLHCLFTHPFTRVENKSVYDLACDIVVDYVLDGLGYEFGEKTAQNKRKAVYKSIIDSFGGVNDITADKFCKNLKSDEIEYYAKIFTLCDHGAWVGRSQNFEKNDGGEISVSFATEDNIEEIEDLLSAWKTLSQSLLPQIGKLNPSLKRILSLKVSPKTNYKNFLRSFLRRRERIMQSDEEFDYIAYYYGLCEYGNMPLIEGLETSDARDWSEIAIAVDTSGSTDGEPIKKLLAEVFSLLKSMETGAKKYAVRIIQCDLKIQKEDLIKSSDEFSKLLENYQLLGGGGTDFTPVFNHLTALKRKGAKIEGLIYFTDGVGVYPREIPPFKTCFALLGDADGTQIPHFAYKINIEV
ncbi:MAG: hypothetical protein IJW64_05085 [Clostridia bacterium]|nr:hypothetical protein [Clostridia bacterium]